MGDGLLINRAFSNLTSGSRSSGKASDTKIPCEFSISSTTPGWVSSRSLSAFRSPPLKTVSAATMAVRGIEIRGLRSLSLAICRVASNEPILSALMIIEMTHWLFNPSSTNNGVLQVSSIEKLLASGPVIDIVVTFTSMPPRLTTNIWPNSGVPLVTRNASGFSPVVRSKNSAVTTVMPDCRSPRMGKLINGSSMSLEVISNAASISPRPAGIQVMIMLQVSPVASGVAAQSSPLFSSSPASAPVKSSEFRLRSPAPMFAISIVNDSATPSRPTKKLNASPLPATTKAPSIVTRMSGGARVSPSSVTPTRDCRGSSESMVSVT